MPGDFDGFGAAPAVAATKAMALKAPATAARWRVDMRCC
jgi:hypothetical protein